MHRNGRGIAAMGGLAAGALLGGVGTADAATFVVDTNADTTLTGCTAADGDCTLRGALSLANANADLDTITFAASVTGTIATTAFLSIQKAVTISGPGADVLTIDGQANGGQRLFYIASSTPSTATVTFAGLTLRGALGTAEGGAILDTSPADLTVTSSVITANTARDGAGINKTASGQGRLTIENSEISLNTVTHASSNVNGGGIFVGSMDPIVIRNSTISGNIANAGPTAVAKGGGIGVAYSSSPPTLINSTITGNSASGMTVLGGGIYSYLVPGTILRNTLVSGNTVSGTSMLGPDLAGSFTGEFAAVGDATGATISDPITGSNIIGVNPQLGTLAANGGPTRTHALAAGSPLIDKGRSFGATSDQRGSARPGDNPAIANSGAAGADGADIGAFEIFVKPVPVRRCQGKKATINAGSRVTKGTARRDVIVGTAARNTIRGLGGNDLICGLGGNDKLIGGAGKDTLLGQGAGDTLLGGPGNDRLLGGPGRDRLIGGPGRDVLLGGGGRDVLRGGPGRDRQRQ